MRFMPARNLFYSMLVIFTVSVFLVAAGAQSSNGAGLSTPAAAKSSSMGSASAAEPALIQPEELVKILKSAQGQQPLIFQVGFHVLYEQAHIPGSEYLGAGSTAGGIAQLRKRVEALPRSQPIVLYCGCCPWNKCPNVRPAYEQLHAMGFNNVKVLYIAHDFGTDWAEKGYPVTSGK